MTTKKAIVERQEFILADIEDGLCTAHCAAARTGSEVCRCRCQGDNHGGLWVIQKPAAVARRPKLRVLQGGRAAGGAA